MQLKDIIYKNQDRQESSMGRKNRKHSFLPAQAVQLDRGADHIASEGPCKETVSHPTTFVSDENL